MSIRTNERSYRSLASVILVEVAKNTILDSKEDQDNGNIAEGRNKAVIAYDLTRTLCWLEGLDESLCPEVEESNYADLVAAANADKALNPEKCAQIDESIQAALAARKETK